MSQRHKFALAREEDPFPHLPIERGKKGLGVGQWVPSVKHTYLAKWIEGTREMRKGFANRVYIDLFSGPGRIEVKDEGLTRLGGAQVAWLHSRLGDAAFTSCITSDLNKGRADACCARLRALGAPCDPTDGPAVDTVHIAFKRVPVHDTLCLAFLDPYNLGYLSWSIIERLADLRRVDFAVHFSSADLQRNVRTDFERQGARFDAVAPGWRDEIDLLSFLRGDADEEFFDYWCRLVESKGFKISDRIPLVRSERNAPLYHLVFFSRHPSPIRVWKDVAQGPNRELF